ncbi:MAG TPA: methionyl-tRNA formyltransferase [Candidatus Dormibacteraeota bacterium]|nr:methionyl-tRNA formyltransferase [Candidatus Dormibacteraeota bacterium]
MRIIFIGTSAFAVPTLKALAAAGHDIAVVVTQPDRPAGRGLELRQPPVKTAAQALGVRVAQPARIRDPEAITPLRAIAPDAIVLAAYGQILPREVLGIPRLGPMNLHASLLPRHRGPAPIAWAILEGDEVTGVSVMRMEERLDTGPVYAQQRVPIAAEDTLESLEDKLAEAGAQLMAATLLRIEAGLKPEPQADTGVTHARRLTTDDGRLDLNTLSAVDVDRRVRALNPDPGVWIDVAGRSVRLLRGHVSGSATAAPGLEVMTANGRYVVEIVQPPGKQAMPVDAFLRGVR